MLHMVELSMPIKCYSVVSRTFITAGYLYSYALLSLLIEVSIAYDIQDLRNVTK